MVSGRVCRNALRPVAASSRSASYSCQRGTDSSTEAEQITCVLPEVIKTEPSACGWNPVSMVIGRG